MRRWIALKGKGSDPPLRETVEMWNFMQTAKWMGVAPWELAGRASFWYEWGSFCAQVDSELGKVEVKQHGNHSG